MKQRFGNYKHFIGSRFPAVLLTAALVTLSTSATATEVYTWTDENGVVHYSDAPRPAGEMEAIEVQEIFRPGSAGVYDQPQESAGEESAVPAAEPQAEQELSAAQQKRQEMARERADRRAAQAETDRLCAQHRQRLEQMEPARRVFYTDEKGETVRMDDDQRMALIDESRSFLADNCGG